MQRHLSSEYCRSVALYSSVKRFTCPVIWYVRARNLEKTRFFFENLKMQQKFEPRTIKILTLSPESCSIVVARTLLYNVVQISDSSNFKNYQNSYISHYHYPSNASQESHGIERDYCAILKSYYRQPDEDRVLFSAVSSDQQSASFLFFCQYLQSIQLFPWSTVTVLTFWK